MASKWQHILKKVKQAAPGIDVINGSQVEGRGLEQERQRQKIAKRESVDRETKTRLTGGKTETTQGKEPGTVTKEDEGKAKEGPTPEGKPTLPLRSGEQVDAEMGQDELWILRGLLDQAQESPKARRSFDALVALYQGKVDRLDREEYPRLAVYLNEDGTLKTLTKSILDNAYLKTGDGHFLRARERVFADLEELKPVLKPDGQPYTAEELIKEMLERGRKLADKFDREERGHGR
jgi:hypothetical protein